MPSAEVADNTHILESCHEASSFSLTTREASLLAATPRVAPKRNEINNLGWQGLIGFCKSPQLFFFFFWKKNGLPLKSVW